jgi:hypothetical protein
VRHFALNGNPPLEWRVEQQSQQTFPPENGYDAFHTPNMGNKHLSSLNIKSK